MRREGHLGNSIEMWKWTDYIAKQSRYYNTVPIQKYNIIIIIVSFIIIISHQGGVTPAWRRNHTTPHSWRLVTAVRPSSQRQPQRQRQRRQARKKRRKMTRQQQQPTWVTNESSTDHRILLFLNRKCQRERDDKYIAAKDWISFTKIRDLTAHHHHYYHHHHDHDLRWWLLPQ